MEKRQRQKKTLRRGRLRDVAAAIIILLLLWQVGALAVRYVAYLRLDLYTAQTMEHTASVPVQLLVLRDETLLPAGEAGLFQPALANGDRVAAHGVVGWMSGQSGISQGTPVISPVSGLVYYDLDGWEEKLSLAQTGGSDWALLIQAWEEEAVTAAAETEEIPLVASGRYVAKVVDNLESFGAFIYCPQDLSNYCREGEARFLWGEEEEPREGELLIRVEDSGWLSGGNYYLLGRINSDAEQLLTERGLSGELIGDSVSGITIPITALYQDSQGELAVYVVRLRRLAFAPVSVSGVYDDMVMVEGLSPGDKVVANPELAQVNQRVYN